jgi:transcription termination factor Rho
MDMPSKNDDETSSASASNEAGAPKKASRRRATTTPRAPRATRTPKTKAAKASSEAELPFAPSEPAPSPAPTAKVAPTPAASAPRDEAPRESSPSSAAESGSGAVHDAAPSGQPAPSAVPHHPPHPPAQSQQQQPSPSHGQGEWQDRGGGGGGGRDFWKRNKRKRGRHGGGPWQPGGGGGNNPPREQHPPQPPPPSNAPIFGELPNPSRFNDLAALATTAQEISSGSAEPFFLNKLYALTLAELTAFARSSGLEVVGAPNRRQLLGQLLANAAEARRAIRDRGYIDLTDRGAFIVHEHVNYRLYPEDAFLPESLINLHGLKRGHRVEVLVQAPLPGERCPSVVRIDSVMGLAPEEISKITPFEELVPYYPLQRILLETPEVQKDVSMRAVDILTPIGFGQRALIVAPPRTGKTVLLQNIANSITENSPHAKLILLLIDERPEEVTDFKRHTQGEVVSSTFDETPESHVHCAEMVIEKSRRLIEQGEHVVILLDSITRLARAYNALAGNGGKTMSGGLESNALQKPKRFFGSARNIEGGGSLTIIASALIDTGSRMDEIIFEEFKGTGNCELHLDRGLVERRIFPAINIDRSGTRKEELIYHPEELQRIYGLRRAMQGLGPIESMEMLITRLKKTKSNAEFLIGLSRA